MIEYNLKKEKDVIEGGNADKVKDLSHFKDQMDQIILGLVVETEHTDRLNEALEITLDHLIETVENLPKDPELRYYTKLIGVEKELGQRMIIDDEVIEKINKVLRSSRNNIKLIGLYQKGLNVIYENDERLDETNKIIDDFYNKLFKPLYSKKEINKMN